MDILLNDSDIIQVVIDFLKSRKLFDSAVALEIESGFLSKKDTLIPEDVRFLRQLMIDGKWDTLLCYLEPFTQLEDFDSNRMYYTIYRQQYYEILQDSFKLSSNVMEHSAKLKSILRIVKPHCTNKEFSELCQMKCQNERQNWSVIGSRIRCFHDLLIIIQPLYDGEEFFNTFPEDDDVIYKNNDLTFALTQAMIHKACMDLCIKKGNNRAEAISNHVELNSAELKDFDNTLPSASLYYWLNSLQNESLFKNSFIEGETKIKFSQLKKNKPPKIVANSLDSVNTKISSFIFQDNLSQSSSKPLKLQPVSIGTGIHQSLSSPRNSNQNNNKPSEMPQNSHDLIPQQENLTDPVPLNHSSDYFTNNKSGVFLLNKPSIESIDSKQDMHSLSVDDKNTNLLKRCVGSNSPKLDAKELENSLLKSSVTTLQIEKKDEEHSHVLNKKYENPDENINPDLNTKDSYAEFLQEKEALRNQKDNLLRDIENKSILRNKLTKDFHPDKSNDIVKRHVNDIRPLNSTQLSSNDPVHNIKQKSYVHQKKFVPLHSLLDSLAIRAVAFHPSGMVYAVGSNTKMLRICSVENDIIANRQININPKNHVATEAEIVSAIPKHHKGSIYCAAWNDEGTLLATASNDKAIKVVGYDVLARNFISPNSEFSFHKGIVRDAVFLPDNLLASGGGDGVVYLTDVIQGKNIHEFVGHADHILCVYSWSSNLIASSSQDKTIRIWDHRVPRCTSIIGISSAEATTPLSVCVNSQGNLLTMGQDNGEIGIYDLVAGKLARKQVVHSDEIRSVRFNTYKASNILLSGSYDSSVTLTDVNELLSSFDSPSLASNCVAKLHDKVIQCRWHPNGRDFACTSAGKTCSFYYSYS